MNDDARNIANKAQAMVGAALEKTIRATALALLGAIVIDTPARTGRLRGNWDVTLDKESTQENYKLYDLAGSSTVSKGNARLAGYKIANTIYITNNINYATYVEDGTANTDGRHMVANAKTRFNAELEKANAKFRIK
jgi:hypothetical protein